MKSSPSTLRRARGGTAVVTMLGLALGLTAPAASTQEPQRSLKEIYGVNATALFADPLPFEPTADAIGNDPRARIVRWNEILMAATALDHTPPATGDPRTFREQFGPGREAMALAIVQIAVFDAINAATGNRFRSYTGLPAVTQPTGQNVAIATAAHDTLVAMWPAQTAEFDRLLAEDLAEFSDRDPLKARGIALGKRAAAAVLAKRVGDGHVHPEPVLGVDYIPGPGPGEWRQDPISRVPIALGAKWGQVRPFVLHTPDQFRIPPPPPLNSAAYTRAFNEVKRLGGDRITTPTQRTPGQTIAGIYWGYDGTPRLSAPPRLYNQIAMVIANQRGTGRQDPINLARLLALLHTGMADAGIACWESKYTYKFWRPVTAIREANRDGNLQTIFDPTFSPLGAPASNINPGVNFTPPFPAYASGHATFGGVLFQTLRRFYGTDDIRFTFVSDEFNGITTDNLGMIRPRIERTFRNFSQAEEENGQSRIYLGIHWEFDKVEGIRQGRRIADFVLGHAFQRR
ncbi:MAG TPA: vanadium-dependent haloperoxidase [Vicinamibacteria bacterium]